MSDIPSVWSTLHQMIVSDESLVAGSVLADPAAAGDIIHADYVCLCYYDGVAPPYRRAK